MGSETVLEGNDHDILGLDDVSVLRIRSQSFFYSGNLPEAPTIDYDDPDIIQQYSEEPIPDRTHESLRDLFNDNMYFRKKWLEAKKEHEDFVENLLQERRLLGSGNTDANLINRIEKQAQNHTFHKRQMANHKFLQPFLGLGRGEQVPLNLDKIKSHHSEMKTDFIALSTLKIFHHPDLTSDGARSQALGELKCKVSSNLYDHPINQIIQSLTGAAVCDWVFGQKLLCVAMLNTPLLEGYRQHIQTICKFCSTDPPKIAKQRDCLMIMKLMRSRWRISTSKCRLCGTSVGGYARPISDDISPTHCKETL
jgi:hypothetical protein